MKNRKLTLSLLAIASSMLLAGCNDIYSRPSSDVKDQTYINNTNVDHNTVEWLYDQLHEQSSTAGDVKDALFKVLEESLFGKVSFTDGDIKVEGFDGETDAKKLEFVKSHKAYWDKAKDSETNDYNYTEPTTVTASITSRINLYKTLIKEQIVKKLYASANISNYKTRDYFYEVKFARNLAGQHYTITGFTQNIYEAQYDKESATQFTNKVLIDNSITDENINSIIGTENNAGKVILHLDLYSDYINKEILPNILETLLIEQYIYDNQYSAISRAHYRKVSYVHINTENKSVSDGRRLVNKFVEKYIKNASAAQGKTINYDLLGKAWKGVYSDLLNTDQTYNEAGQLLVESGFQLGTPKKDGKPILNFADGKAASEYPYFENTSYGNLIEDYAKITLSPKTTDSSVESEFTSNGMYNIETGLGIKTNDIRIVDYTTTAWGTNDNGLSSLPSDTKTRLFDYTVISDFGSEDLTKNSYLQEVNGHYFIKKSVSQSDDASDSIVIKDGSNFYIVEVLEVPSQSKLTLGGSDSYSAEKLEEVSRRIGYDLASGTTYKNNAFKHYLADCEIIYHDQSMYDYFRSTYPELFND